MYSHKHYKYRIFLILPLFGGSTLIFVASSFPKIFCALELSPVLRPSLQVLDFSYTWVIVPSNTGAPSVFDAPKQIDAVHLQFK